MPLSEDEQSRLREIEAGTRAADPVFAARLDLAAAQRRHGWWIVVCWSGIWLGATVMMTGVGAARGLISGGTLVGCYGVVLMVASAVAALRATGHSQFRRLNAT